MPVFRWSANPMLRKGLCCPILEARSGETDEWDLTLAAILGDLAGTGGWNG
jgi:hypothetical protein